MIHIIIFTICWVDVPFFVPFFMISKLYTHKKSHSNFTSKIIFVIQDHFKVTICEKFFGITFIAVFFKLDTSLHQNHFKIATTVWNKVGVTFLHGYSSIFVIRKGNKKSFKFAVFLYFCHFVFKFRYKKGTNYSWSSQ